MMRRLTRWIGSALLAALLGSFLSGNRAAAQTPPATEDAQPTAEEKDGCIRNLTMIYEAIQAYRADHKDLPNWLSDLVPQYINDANVLICPVCRRTGQAETSALADPKIPSSYFFQFCPLPLGRELPNDPNRTRREWKRRQMGVVGAVVPLVRCRHHGVTLNLGFDGKIYESPAMWEMLMSNVVNPADLTPAKLFPSTKEAALARTAASPPVLKFERRDPNAKANLIGLTDYYNAMLTESWHGMPMSSNDLSSLPTGLQKFGGVEFDVRGIVQLGSKSDSVARFPPQIKGINVGQKCQRLHFLHAVAFANAGDEGREVGKYIVHFAANNLQAEIPIVCGRDVRDWHSSASEKPGEKELNVAWTGTNAVSKAAGRSIRLFLTTWENITPGVEIQSLDYVSAMGTPAPFLIAITAD